MHELSIALSVLDLVEEEAARRGNAIVKAVHIRLGPLSGVIKQALASAYDLAREGTALEGCELVVEETPLSVHCATCGTFRPTQSIDCVRCPECGGENVQIVGGRELEVIALEIES